MVRWGPWLAPLLTLLSLGAALAAALDSQRTAVYTIAATVIAAGSLAVFLRERQRRPDADWSLTAPAMLELTLLSAVTPVGLGIGALLVLAAAAVFGWGARQRDLSVFAEATSAGAWLATAAGLALVAAIGGAHGAVVWLPVVALWLLVWMPSATRSIHHQHTVHVRRPRDELSAYLMDQRNLPAWYPGYESCELLDGHQLGKGATFRQVINLRGRRREARVTVDDYEPGQRLRTSVVDEPRRASGSYTFLADEDGTQAVYEVQGEQSYPTALTGSMLVIRATLRRVTAQRQAAFDNLKAVLEA
jgi:hypothetical protein